MPENLDPFARSAETPQWRAMFEAAHYLSSSLLVKYMLYKHPEAGDWRVVPLEPHGNGVNRHLEKAEVIAKAIYAEETQALRAHEDWLAEQKRSHREEWIADVMQKALDARPDATIDVTALRAEVTRWADLMGIA